MLRIGYLASNTGTIPFSTRATGEYLLRESGQNTGNLAFWYSTRRLFSDPITLVEWGLPGIQHKPNIDRFVIPAANHLNPQWDLGALADLIEGLDKEVLVFGLGAQAQDETERCILQPGTIRYLEALSRHARTIFVRGEYTAEVCNSYGVKNVVVAGCPSLMMNPDPDLGVFIEGKKANTFERLYFSGAAFKDELISIERTFFAHVAEYRNSTYVIQTHSSLIDLVVGQRAIDSAENCEEAHEILAPGDPAIDFLKKFSGVGRCFSSIPAWLEEASRHDYAVGTRIHGSIIAMMAGIPTLVVGHDARIRELCQVMKIPCVMPSAIPSDIEAVRVLVSDSVGNGSIFDENRQHIAKVYHNYLADSGLSVAPGLARLSSLPIKTRSDAGIDTGAATLLHQRDHSTELNRYPTIFRAVANMFSGKPAPKILSYGCSTGQEVDTLANLYFKQSQIVGVDIDRKSLDVADLRNTNPERVKFALSTSKNLQELGPFDLIFAMTIFCRWPDTKGQFDITGIYPFASFEAGIAEIDAHLTVGGLLILANTNFAFEDTRLWERYRNHPIGIASSGFVERFTSANIATKLPAPPSCIFEKMR